MSATRTWAGRSGIDEILLDVGPDALAERGRCDEVHRAARERLQLQREAAEGVAPEEVGAGVGAPALHVVLGREADCYLRASGLGLV